ncbi:MAG: type II toxin-antitoxin system HicA family toxin [Microbacteriaceae bacterium]|nr:type II toxin-antitoxin system HicA family toxin [Microbacteriaceae bacterium]
MLRILLRHGYAISRQNGSHRHLKGDGLPDVLFSYHDGVTLAPGAVRKMLVKDVGLSEDEALKWL